MGSLTQFMKPVSTALGLHNIAKPHVLAVQNNAEVMNFAPRARLRREDVELRVYDIQNVPLRVAGGYAASYSAVFSEHNSFLDALDMNQVLSGENGLAVALQDDEVIAGCWYSRSNQDVETWVKIAGLISTGKVRGVAAPLVSAIWSAEQERDPIPVFGRAIVRIMPDNRYNVLSSRALSQSGFYPAEDGSQNITARNVHLALTAEPDGESFRYAEFIADPAMLKRNAAINLADWAKE